MPANLVIQPSSPMTEQQEIEQLKNEILELGHRVSLSVYERAQAEIDQLKDKLTEALSNAGELAWYKKDVQKLLTRAADALEESSSLRTVPRLRIKEQQLIEELRKAAE